MILGNGAGGTQAISVQQPMDQADPTANLITQLTQAGLPPADVQKLQGLPPELLMQLLQSLAPASDAGAKAAGNQGAATAGPNLGMGSTP